MAKNRIAAHFGRMGGRAASRKLTPEQLKERARRAALARWAKVRAAAPAAANRAEASA